MTILTFFRQLVTGVRPEPKVPRSVLSVLNELEYIDGKTSVREGLNSILSYTFSLRAALDNDKPEWVAYYAYQVALKALVTLKAAEDGRPHTK